MSILFQVGSDRRILSGMNPLRRWPDMSEMSYFQAAQSMAENRTGKMGKAGEPEWRRAFRENEAAISVDEGQAQGLIETPEGRFFEKGWSRRLGSPRDFRRARQSQSVEASPDCHTGWRPTCMQSQQVPESLPRDLMPLTEDTSPVYGQFRRFALN